MERFRVVWGCALLTFVYLSLTTVNGAGITITGPKHDRVVVCYLATWAVYRPGKGSFSIDDLDPSLCTHIVYAFAGLNVTGNSIRSLDPWQDLKDDYGKGGYEKATGLKIRYPHLKVTLAIGGWNEGSINYSKLAENKESRQIFINSVLAFLRKYKFDGLDLDWEYPSKRGGDPKDRENFVLLVKELKTEFRKHGLILTAALGASKETIDVSYDVAQLAEYLDLIHMMCYDYHGTWDGVVGPNAPLHAEAPSDLLSVEFTVNYMIKMGAPPEKLVLGLPLYGRTFVRDSNSLGMSRQPVSSEAPKLGSTKVQPAGFQGPFTKEAGFMGYHEICVELSNATSEWNQDWDENSQAPYAYNGDKFITFDNQRSIAEKVRFAINKRLRGLMVWSIDTDDFRGDCPAESDVFSEFYDNLKTLEKNPYFKEILPDLGLSHTFEDDLQKANYTTENAYMIQNGDLTLLIPLRSSTNYPLMRTIHQAVVLSQQEEILIKKFEKKIREKEKENEVSQNRQEGSNSALRISEKTFLVSVLAIILPVLFN